MLKWPFTSHTEHVLAENSRMKSSDFWCTDTDRHHAQWWLASRNPFISFEIQIRALHSTRCVPSKKCWSDAKRALYAYIDALPVRPIKCENSTIYHFGHPPQFLSQSLSAQDAFDVMAIKVAFDPFTRGIGVALCVCRTETAIQQTVNWLRQIYPKRSRTKPFLHGLLLSLQYLRARCA